MRVDLNTFVAQSAVSSAQWPTETAGRPAIRLQNRRLTGISFSEFHGALFLSDASNSCIYKANLGSDGSRISSVSIAVGKPSGEWQRRHGAVADTRFREPTGVAVDSVDGTVYICDGKDHRVLRLDGGLSCVDPLVGNGGTTLPLRQSFDASEMFSDRKSISLVYPTLSVVSCKRERNLWIACTGELYRDKRSAVSRPYLVYATGMSEIVSLWVEQCMMMLKMDQRITSVLATDVLLIIVELAAPGLGARLSTAHKRGLAETNRRRYSTS